MLSDMFKDSEKKIQGIAIFLTVVGMIGSFIVGGIYAFYLSSFSPLGFVWGLIIFGGGCFGSYVAGLIFFVFGECIEIKKKKLVVLSKIERDLYEIAQNTSGCLYCGNSNGYINYKK